MCLGDDLRPHPSRPEIRSALTLKQRTAIAVLVDVAIFMVAIVVVIVNRQN